MDISAFFPNPFASKPAAPKAPEAAPAANAAKPAGDSLALSARPAAAPAKPAEKPVQLVPKMTTMDAVLGVGSAGVAAALTGWGLISVLALPAVPVLIGTAAVGGVLALAGVGLANNWGEKKPFLHGLMTRTVGAIGIAGCMVGGGLAMALTAMTLPGIAGAVCWPALVLAEACMGLLAFGMFKQPVQTPGLPVQPLKSLN